MSATDELRRLLDERGVKHSDYDGITEWCGRLGAVCRGFQRYSDNHLDVVIVMTDSESAVNATLGSGKCCYIPDEQGYRWRLGNGEWQEEEDSASDECWSASCDKCGYSMIVGDDGGWFHGYDELKEWLDEDGKEHRGFILEPIFNFCPNCGRKVER